MTETSNTSAVPVSASQYVEQIERTFEISDLSTALVSVSNVSGSVAVESWDKADVLIRATKRAQSQRAFEHTRIEFEQSGDQISARTVIDEEVFLTGILDFLRSEKSGASVEYAVKVPAACAVHAKIVNGPLTVSGLSNQTEANAVNGSVSLRQLSGRIDAEATNGALLTEQVSGEAELSTVNGSIELRDARLQSLNARTVSGSLRGALVIDPQGNYAFNSTNGNCELTTPLDSRCTIQMEAVNGGVECQLPHQTISSEMRPAFSRWQGAINGGGARLTFKTVNGRLRIEPSQAIGAANAESNKDEQHEDRPLEILRAIERGEISVEEAMQKLRGAAK